MSGAIHRLRRSSTRWWASAEGRAATLVVLFLGFLALLKIVYVAKGGAAVLRYDGAYYRGIAEQVRDGYGLSTNVSVLHKGYSYFPHPTAVYPLWPLLYGYLGRLVDLSWLGVWLPSILHLMSLALAYRWGKRIAPASLFPSVLPGFNSGHLLMLILGLHPQLFQHTTQPYTEALGYTILFAALLRWDVALERPGLVTGLEAGVWASFAFLARSQFVVVLIALYSTMLWATLIDRPARRERVAAFLASFSVCVIAVGVYLAWVRTFIPAAGLHELVRFDEARESQLLSPVSMLVDTPQALTYLVDRASGFPVAFALDGKFAYARSYYLFQYGLPLLLASLALSMRGRLLRTATVAGRWLRRPATVRQVFVIVLCLGGFLSIHTVHKEIFAEWNFPLRQGLTAAPIFCFCLALLLRRTSGTVLILATCLVATSTGLGMHSLVSLASKAKPRRRANRSELALWLQSQADANGGDLIVATGDPQDLALMTRTVRYHAIMSQRTTVDDAIRMVENLGSKYLLLATKRYKRWRLYENPAAFNDAFTVAHTIGGTTVFVPTEPSRPPDPPAPAARGT